MLDIIIIFNEASHCNNIWTNTCTLKLVFWILLRNFKVISLDCYSFPLAGSFTLLYAFHKSKTLQWSKKMIEVRFKFFLSEMIYEWSKAIQVVNTIINIEKSTSDNDENTTAASVRHHTVLWPIWCCSCFIILVWSASFHSIHYTSLCN